MELCYLGDDKSISIWDLASNGLLTELKGHKDTVMNVDWSLDGQYIASASLDGIVRLWPTQDFIKTLNGYMLKSSFLNLKICLYYISSTFFQRIVKCYVAIRSATNLFNILLKHSLIELL